MLTGFDRTLGRSISYSCDQTLLQCWILDDDIFLRELTNDVKPIFLTHHRHQKTRCSTCLVNNTRWLDHNTSILLDHNYLLRSCTLLFFWRIENLQKLFETIFFSRFKAIRFPVGYLKTSNSTNCSCESKIFQMLETRCYS